MDGSVEVVVDDTEQTLARVAAIDVAKASGKVCVRVPHDTKEGTRVTRVFDVVATVPAVEGLADHLVCQGIERVVLESTSDYWRVFYYLLEERGLEVWLVNARDVKNVPGRPKTDKLDAVWLAKLNERGMLRRSFVPPVDIRRMRDVTRMRVDLVADRTRAKQRSEKVLEGALVKLSSVVSDLFAGGGAADPRRAGGRGTRPAPARGARDGPEGLAGGDDRGADRPVQRPRRLPAEDLPGAGRRARPADRHAVRAPRGDDRGDAAARPPVRHSRTRRGHRGGRGARDGLDRHR
ncbi:hypothetical protein FMEAI12_3150002 [Parafrankia sp. Ea1.12]|nr:hypothetical protein FMEAI12_3150002 [Parafrankia sp. Ea1.12]